MRSPVITDLVKLVTKKPSSGTSAAIDGKAASDSGLQTSSSTTKTPCRRASCAIARRRSAPMTLAVGLLKVGITTSAVTLPARQAASNASGRMPSASVGSPRSAKPSTLASPMMPWSVRFSVEHQVARPHDRGDAQEDAVRGAVGDEDAVALRRDAQPLEPDSCGIAVTVEPGDRPARAHEGAVVGRRQFGHQGARRRLVLRRVGGADDREVGDLRGCRGRA